MIFSKSMGKKLSNLCKMAWLSAEMIKIQEATMIDILGTRVHDLYKGKCNKHGEHDGAIVFLTLAEWLSG